MGHPLGAGRLNMKAPQKRTGWVYATDGIWWYGNGHIEPQHFSCLTAPPKLMHLYPERPKAGQQLKLPFK
jgi:hypothetical protein